MVKFIGESKKEVASQANRTIKSIKEWQRKQHERLDMIQQYADCGYNLQMRPQIDATEQSIPPVQQQPVQEQVQPPVQERPIQKRVKHQAKQQVKPLIKHTVEQQFEEQVKRPVGRPRLQKNEQPENVVFLSMPGTVLFE